MSCSSIGSNVSSFEKGMYIGINLQNVLYGIELLLYFKTMRVFLARRREPHKSDFFYALFSTAMFVLITIWVASLGTFGQRMWLLNRKYPGGPMAYFMAHTPAVYMDIGRVGLTTVQQMTDALMIYRCRIVWGSHRVVILPSVVWLANLGLGILLDWSSSTPGTTFFSGIAAKLGLAYYSTSAFLNLTLTCMICYRLLSHARIIKDLGDKHASAYLNIVVLVFESILPFTLSSIIFLVCYGLNNEAGVVTSFVHPLMMVISPQMLILRVADGEAWRKDESGIPESIIRGLPSLGQGDAVSRSVAAARLETLSHLHHQCNRWSTSSQVVPPTIYRSKSLQGVGLFTMSTSVQQVRFSV